MWASGIKLNDSLKSMDIALSLPFLGCRNEKEERGRKNRRERKKKKRWKMNHLYVYRLDSPLSLSFGLSFMSTCNFMSALF